ncbi:MAG: hypothetical protein FGM54_03825 [Chitinophagaceae bacterium]|nr:hypothetical protein [Chitinophagaceae bacterium]
MNELDNSIKSIKQENNNLKEKHKLQANELEDKIKFLKVVSYTTIWVLIGFMGFSIFFLKNMNSFKKVFSVFF